MRFVLVHRRGVGEGCRLRRYARLVGAPNSAPSLRSVAGLLLALALESAYEDTLASRYSVVTAAARSAARVWRCPPVSRGGTRTMPSCARPAGAVAPTDHRRTRGTVGESGGCPLRRRSASDQETRDRAERGSAVRGSARASVVAVRPPSRLTGGVISKTKGYLACSSSAMREPSYIFRSASVMPRE